MPIYRVPEMSSAQNFQNRHNHQPPNDHRLRGHDHHHHHHHHHQQQQQQQQQHHQQQHHHHYHREQPFLEHMQTHNLSNENVSMKRSHSNPSRMTDSTAADSAAAADESIVEREIRLQLEKEAEFASLHKDQRSGRRSPPPEPRRTAPDHSGFRDGPDSRRAARSDRIAGEAAAAGNSREVVGHDDGDEEEDGEDRRAIGHYSRAGDSIIVKELKEQKKREQELRSRYRNTGPIRDCRVENGKATAAPAGKTEPGSRFSSSSSLSSSSYSGGVRQATKVQPLVDPEEEDDDEDEEGGDEEDDEVDFRQIYIKPQSETLIEREVRLLRQREGSLRRVRGYPLPPREERLTEVGKVPAGGRPPPLTTAAADDDHPPPGGQRRRPGEAAAAAAATGDGLDMRRLATNRLKQEMLKERQREIDLRRQGKICTISEERVGLDPSHLAVGPDDGNGRRQSGARGGAAASFDDDDDLAGLSTNAGHLHGVGYDDAPPLPRPGSPVRPPPPPPRQQQQQQQQQRRSTDSGEAATSTMPPWRMSAEMRIEAEVREARRREKELREQRRLLNAALPTNPQPDQSSEEKNRSIYRRT